MLKDKVAVVTGASRGIGKAIAVALAEDGASVAVNYATKTAQANEVVDEIKACGGRAIAVKADVSNTKEVELMVGKVLQEFGKVDILVNNAGITRDRSIRKMSESEWRQVIDVNLNGTFNCIRCFLPYLKKDGRIVNISSVTAERGNFGQANYCASKAAINSLTKTLARELARDGITVNAVAPGFTETDMTSAISEELRRKYIDRIPLGHPCMPEDVANIVLYLVSRGGYITGQVINIDGGFML